MIPAPKPLPPIGSTIHALIGHDITPCEVVKHLDNHFIEVSIKACIGTIIIGEWWEDLNDVPSYLFWHNLLT